MNIDRTVHGRTGDGTEIVRYDRAGKWYAEPSDRRPRQPLSVHAAAELATAPGSVARLRKPGGGAFDRAVRRLRGARAQ